MRLTLPSVRAVHRIVSKNVLLIYFHKFNKLTDYKFVATAACPPKKAAWIIYILNNFLYTFGIRSMEIMETVKKTLQSNTNLTNSLYFIPD